MEPVAWEFAWTGTSDPRSSLTAFVSRNRFWIQPPRLTEVSWRRGISAAALTRTVISGLRGHGRRGQQKHAAAEERERESRSSAAVKACMKSQNIFTSYSATWGCISPRLEVTVDRQALSACLSLYSGCPVQSSDALFEYAGRHGSKNILGSVVTV